MEFEVLPVTRYRMNCSILWCEKTLRAAVIDPGGDLSEILNFIEILELQPEVALVTHGHFDHCGAAAAFAKATGARIEGPHRGDAAMIERLPFQSSQFAEMARARTDRPEAEVIALLESATANSQVASFEPARWLDHGDRVRFGAEELEVLHCPGHSSGHVAYFSRSARQAFVGDILFRGSIGAWEHPDGDLPMLVHSIRDRLFPLGDDVGFVPGHGEASTFGRERRDNPFVGDIAYARWRERLQTASSE